MIDMLGEEKNVSFLPLHGLDEQPKLIKAGYMKDYQVRSSWSRIRLSLKLTFGDV